MTTFRGQNSPISGDPYPTPDELSTSVAAAAASEAAAAVSADAAQTSETAAEAAQTAAEAAQTAAETAETNAETAETNAAASASAASTSESNASTSETNAATSETNASTSETNAAASAASLLNKNLIGNPAFQIQQMGGYTGASNGSLIFDRWKWYQSGTMVIDSSQEETSSIPADTGGREPRTNCKVNTTTADASLAAGDYATMATAIMVEDIEQYYDESVTLSFYVRSNLAGTFCVAVRSPDETYTYLKEITIDSADTWEKKSFTFTLDTGSGDWTWTDRRDKGLRLFFSLAAGSTFQSTKDQWNSGAFFGTSGCDNYVGAVNRNFEITAVKLEGGSTASAFLTPKFDKEFESATFYFQSTYPYGTNPGSVSGGYLSYRQPLTDNQMTANIRFHRPMRSSPTVTFYSQATGASGKVRDASSSSDVTASIAVGNAAGYSIISLGTNIADQDRVDWHNTVDAEIA